jgi:hypothetical protein
VDNIKKVAKSVKKGVDDLVEGEMDWKEYYNSNPEKGVCFKGRVLVEFKIKSKRPPKYESSDVAPFRRKIPALR